VVGSDKNESSVRVSGTLCLCVRPHLSLLLLWDCASRRMRPKDEFTVDPAEHYALHRGVILLGPADV
jgi:hypothetical protein